MISVWRNAVSLRQNKSRISNLLLCFIGPGSYARMKAAMHSHVAVERDTMFQRSAAGVRKQLQAMVKEIEVLMDDKANEVFMSVKRDYRAVLGGGDASQDGQMLPREQRLVRREIIQIIDGVEKIFMKVAGLPVEDDDEEEEADQGRKPKRDQDSEVDSHDDDDGEEQVVKEETGTATIKREATPSAQLNHGDEPPWSVSSKNRQLSIEDHLMEAASSDQESEPNLHRPNVREGTVEEGDDYSEASSAEVSSDSE